MGVELLAAIQGTNTYLQYRQGEKQMSFQKKQMMNDLYQAGEQREIANQEAIAQKQALIAEQESMSSQAENQKKKKTSYQKQAASWQSTGVGFGLGNTSNGKLG